MREKHLAELGRSPLPAESRPARALPAPVGPVEARRVRSSAVLAPAWSLRHPAGGAVAQREWNAPEQLCSLPLTRRPSGGCQKATDPHLIPCRTLAHLRNVFAPPPAPRPPFSSPSPSVPAIDSGPPPRNLRLPPQTPCGSQGRARGSFQATFGSTGSGEQDSVSASPKQTPQAQRPRSRISVECVAFSRTRSTLCHFAAIRVLEPPPS